jgi:hypothetical protein
MYCGEDGPLLQWNAVSREPLIKFTSYFGYQISDGHFKLKSEHNSRPTPAQLQGNYSATPGQLERTARATAAQSLGHYRSTPAQRQGNYTEMPGQLQRNARAITPKCQRNSSATPGQLHRNVRATPAQLTKYSSDITIFRVNLQRKIYALFVQYNSNWVSQFQIYIEQNWANMPELTRRANIS